MSRHVLFNLGNFSHAYPLSGLFQWANGGPYNCHLHHGRIRNLRAPDMDSPDHRSTALSTTFWKQLRERPLGTGPSLVIFLGTSTRLCLQRGCCPKETESPSDTSCKGDHAHGRFHWLQFRLAVFSVLHIAVRKPIGPLLHNNFICFWTYDYEDHPRPSSEAAIPVLDGAHHPASWWCRSCQPSTNRIPHGQCMGRIAVPTCLFPICICCIHALGGSGH